MYSLAGLDGPAGGQRAAAAKPESSSDAEKRNLGVCTPLTGHNPSTRTPPPDARDLLQAVRGRQHRDVPGVTGDVPRGAVGHGHPPEGFH